jgi:hypothetical protein
VWNANLVKTQPKALDGRDASRDDIARKSERRTTSEGLTNNFYEEHASVSSHGADGEIINRMEMHDTDLTATAKAGLDCLLHDRSPGVGGIGVR